jgi:hypothetical protein
MTEEEYAPALEAKNIALRKAHAEIDKLNETINGMRRVREKIEELQDFLFNTFGATFKISNHYRD